MTVGQRIEAALEAAVAAGIPGVAAAARLADGTEIARAAGVRTQGERAAMTQDSVFWIASCTKAITTAAVLQLMEARQLDLDAPVARWLPMLTAPKRLDGFDADGKPRLSPTTAAITTRHLLAHTSGLGYEFCNEDLTRYVAAAGPYPRGLGPDAPVLFEPGAGWAYGIGLDWAGKLVEAISGEPLADYFQRHIFAPLGMCDTSFFPDERLKARSVAMHAHTADGWAPIPFGMPDEPHFGMGGGGLYSTASDYLRFLCSILEGGGEILSPASVALMSAPQWEGVETGVLPAVNRTLCVGYDPFPGRTKRWGLSFAINAEPGPNGRAAGSLAWGGLGNCVYWVDPTSRVAGVFLAQYFPFGDPAALEAFGAFERAVYSA
jgi:CubicO group peptidase (beta-lactamase class C family)